MSSENSDELAGDELLAEYYFDYQKVKPNRFALRNGGVAIVLDEDVAKVFTTSESVNKALRALIEVMPRSSDQGAS